MQIFNNPNYNFIRWRWHAIALSALVILAGLAMIIDAAACRSASTSPAARIVVVQFEQPVDRRRGARRRRSPASRASEVVQQYGDAGGHASG